MPDDAAAIARIHVDTWRDTYAGILPDRVLLNMSTAREGGGWSGLVLRGESVFVVQGPMPGLSVLAAAGRIDCVTCRVTVRYIRYTSHPKIKVMGSVRH